MLSGKILILIAIYKIHLFHSKLTFRLIKMWWNTSVIEITKGKTSTHLNTTLETISSHSIASFFFQLQFLTICVTIKELERFSIEQHKGNVTHCITTAIHPCTEILLRVYVFVLTYYPLLLRFLLFRFFEKNAIAQHTSACLPLFDNNRLTARPPSLQHFDLLTIIYLQWTINIRSLTIFLFYSVGNHG